LSDGGADASPDDADANAADFRTDAGANGVADFCTRELLDHELVAVVELLGELRRGGPATFPQDHWASLRWLAVQRDAELR
jgi:hypothetical protein